MSQPQKVGIFSGTFDPIHVGHVEFALDATRLCELSTVAFLPEAQPRQKTPATLEHRVNMLKLATAKHAKLAVVQLPQQQFTVDTTLPQLQKLYPSAQLVFLLGSDLVQTFSYRWPELDLLLSSAHLAIGLRAGDQKSNVHDQLLSTYTHYGLEPNYTLLPSPYEHLASTSIRKGTHTIHDISPQVANYIKQHKLYQ
jgi:nicotinate-nucleotide adenylyltransferase